MKFPSSGGAFQDMITNLETGIAPAPIPLRGTALAWWDPKAAGGSNQIGIPGTGKYAYLNGGKRYLTREVPGQAAAVLRRVEVDLAVRHGARRRT